MTLPPELEALSDDAKAVGASFFPTIASRVTFHMEEKQPGARCQAGLDELVAAGLVSRVVHNAKTGAATYRPIEDIGALTGWHAHRTFVLNDPINLVLWEKRRG